MSNDLRTKAREMAARLGRPVYIVKDKDKKLTVVSHMPGSIEWRSGKYEWVETIKPHQNDTKHR